MIILDYKKRQDVHDQILSHDEDCKESLQGVILSDCLKARV